MTKQLSETQLFYQTPLLVSYCLVYQNHLENKGQICWLKIYSFGDNVILRLWWAYSGELFSSHIDLNQELFLLVGISKLFSYWKCSTFTINSTKTCWKYTAKIFPGESLMDEVYNCKEDFENQDFILVIYECFVVYHRLYHQGTTLIKKQVLLKTRVTLVQNVTVLILLPKHVLFDLLSTWLCLVEGLYGNAMWTAGWNLTPV